MTNLHCTTDHHAVPLLNIRPVESGVIPDHFSTGCKTYPAHYDLSERARPTPLYFRPTYALPDQGPLIADPSIFPERERTGVDRVSGVNGPKAVDSVLYNQEYNGIFKTNILMITVRCLQRKAVAYF